MAEPQERFLCSPGLKLEAHTRMTDMQFVQVASAMARLEAAKERLEKRLWVTVFGVVAAILSEAFASILNLVP